MRATKRREHVRVNIPGVLQGSVDLRYDVQVIDLSPRGALVEHAVPLAPGRACFLFLCLHGADVRLRGHIVWSHVKGIRSGANGEGEIRFRSGFHFPDLPEADEAQVRRFLATVSAAKSDPPQPADRLPPASATPSLGIPEPRTSGP